ncbi:glycosyltransferase [Bacillus lacus]|uniref:Glycosyltransferase n=1 Tax=Metabacillus lacus TaxID=1983721 RepID=A0A7X2IZ63_9BACI|nr:glycosyltransferase family 2 protein [Metabacillus lacus]MRX72192.1 glycosyltransferase [Metabacillus lacus]
MRPTLSICMIIKNEEEVLTRCLESIKGIADEIIIVDTGSTDSSKFIGIKYTNMVFDYKWEGNFSNARNFAASKATGEWILALDADEYVDRESLLNFKEELKENPPEENIIAVQIVNFLGTSGNSTSLNYHERLYKNDGSIMYYRNIHELLKHKDSKENRGLVEFQIFHTGYMGKVEKEKDKSKRNLSMLINKKDKEPIDYYFIGNEYDKLGELNEAIDYYKNGFALKDNINSYWVKKLLVRLINSLQRANKNNEALEIAETCEKIYSDIVDYRFFKAKIYYEKGDFGFAKSIFEDILMKKDVFIANSSGDYLEFLPHLYLGEIFEKDNQLHLAVQHYTKAISINDLDDYVWMRLINLLGQHSTKDDLEIFINKNCLNRKSMSQVRMVKILLSVPNLNIQKLTKSIGNSGLSNNEQEALSIKLLFIEGEFEGIMKILDEKSINELNKLLSIGIFNLVDFILLTIVTNKPHFKSFLKDLKSKNSINNLLSVLFGKRKKLSSFEEELFIALLKQAHIISNSKLMINLNKKIDTLSVKSKIRYKKEMTQYKLIK